MLWFLLTLSAFLVQAGPQTMQQGLETEAESVMRSDLSRELPPQIFLEGFAVLKVRLTNHQDSDWSLDPDQVIVLNPKGKQLEQARGTDIAPRLINYFRGKRPLYGAEVYRGSRIPRTTQVDRRPDPAERGSSTLSADQGRQLRELFDAHRLQSGTLQKGQTAEGYLYVVSKKSGTKLRGGTVRFADGTQAEIR